MSKSVVYAITFFVCLVLQVGIAPAIALGSAAPNFLLIPVLLVALKSGYAAGSAAGFACGLFEDFAGDGVVGCMALTMTLVAAIVGLVGSTIDTKSPLITCVIVLCACLLVESGYGVSVILSNAEVGGVLATVVGHVLPSTVYSAVFGCIALVTISLVLADDSAGMGGFGGSSLGGSPSRMPRMKSRLR